MSRVGLFWNRDDCLQHGSPEGVGKERVPRRPGLGQDFLTGVHFERTLPKDPCGCWKNTNSLPCSIRTTSAKPSAVKSPSTGRRGFDSLTLNVAEVKGVLVKKSARRCATDAPVPWIQRARASCDACLPGRDREAGRGDRQCALSCRSPFFPCPLLARQARRTPPGNERGRSRVGETGPFGVSSGRSTQPPTLPPFKGPGPKVSAPVVPGAGGDPFWGTGMFGIVTSVALPEGLKRPRTAVAVVGGSVESYQ